MTAQTRDTLVLFALGLLAILMVFSAGSDPATLFEAILAGFR